MRAEKPLVLVIALGIFGIEPLELLQAARVDLPALPIFLIGDRDGELPDEDTAARVGATRLFLRPIDANALADAIEKRAVEAEVAEDVAEAMAEFDVRPPTIDAEPLVEESIVEMEADFSDDGETPPQTLAKIALKRMPTEVMKGVIEVPASKPHIEASVGKVEAMLEMDADEPTPTRRRWCRRRCGRRRCGWPCRASRRRRRRRPSRRRRTSRRRRRWRCRRSIAGAAAGCRRRRAALARRRRARRRSTSASSWSRRTSWSRATSRRRRA